EKTMTQSLIVRSNTRSKRIDDGRPADFDHPNYNNRLVADLVQAAGSASALLGNSQGIISKFLVEGLADTLLRTANMVSLYVLEEATQLADIRDPAHALYVLRKEVLRLENQEREKSVVAKVKEALR